MKVVGLMAGTSVDGVDVALCDIAGAPPKLEATILETFFMPFPSELRQQTLDNCIPEKSSVQAICRANFAIAEVFAEGVKQLIKQAGLTSKDVDLIGYPGQTIWHEVGADGSVIATLQIGESAILAERTGITTIGQLRTRDVAVGGHGAPLTGYVDWLLLRHPTKWRAIQNIGGMGNVTFLPPLSDTKHQPIALDTGPGNALIDGAMTVLTRGEQNYDKNGEMAIQGQVDEDWLDTLLRHAYFARGYPKTTGRELFGMQMVTELIAEGRQRHLPDADIVNTITMLTATSIADAYERFAPARIDEVILGGGGGNNQALVQMLETLLGNAKVMSHEDIGLDSDFKEALVMAVIAYESWHLRPGNHPSISGGQKPAILGHIVPGNNYLELMRETWC